MSRPLSFPVLLLISIVLVALADRFGGRIDLTRERIHSLSTRSLEVLTRLDEKVEAVAFYRPEDPAAAVIEELLERYAASSGHFHYSIVDPDRNPALAKSLKATTYGTTVLKAGEREERLYNWSEESFTSAVVRIVRTDNPLLLVVEGHGENGFDSDEPDGMSRAWQKIRSEGIRVESFLSAASSQIPDSTDLIVVAGPKVAFDQREIDQFEDYIRAGGKMLLLLDPDAGRGPDDLAGRFGMEAREDVIVDQSNRLFGADMQMPVVVEYDLHDATRDLSGTTLFPHSRSIALFRGGEGGGEVRSLLRTSDRAWGETDRVRLGEGDAAYEEGTDHPGPLLLGMIASVSAGSNPEGGVRRGRLALLGDSDFATNRYISHGVNAELLLGLVRYLVAGKEPLGIVAPGREDELLILTAAEGQFLFWGAVVGLPALVALAGTITVTRWRRSG